VGVPRKSRSSCIRHLRILRHADRASADDGDDAAGASRAGEEKYGLQIVAVVGLPSGTVHPILVRLDGLGWLESRWENHDPREQGRPQRRYYRLTAGIVLPC
jgi:hypothetical protein